MNQLHLFLTQIFVVLFFLVPCDLTGSSNDDTSTNFDFFKDKRFLISTYKPPTQGAPEQKDPDHFIGFDILEVKKASIKMIDKDKPQLIYDPQKKTFSLSVEKTFEDYAFISNESGGNKLTKTSLKSQTAIIQQPIVMEQCTTISHITTYTMCTQDFIDHIKQNHIGIIQIKFSRIGAMRMRATSPYKTANDSFSHKENLQVLLDTATLNNQTIKIEPSSSNQKTVSSTTEQPLFTFHFYKKHLIIFGGLGICAMLVAFSYKFNFKQIFA